MQILARWSRYETEEKLAISHMLNPASTEDILNYAGEEMRSLFAQHGPHGFILLASESFEVYQRFYSAAEEFVTDGFEELFDQARSNFLAQCDRILADLGGGSEWSVWSSVDSFRYNTSERSAHGIIAALNEDLFDDFEFDLLPSTGTLMVSLSKPETTIGSGVPGERILCPEVPRGKWVLIITPGHREGAPHRMAPIFVDDPNEPF